MADGRIELEVAPPTAQALYCRVFGGGVLRSHTGINFPTHSLSVPALRASAKDKADIRFGEELGVDYMALS
jgi:pyruvate kinase